MRDQNGHGHKTRKGVYDEYARNFYSYTYI